MMRALPERLRAFAISEAERRIAAIREASSLPPRERRIDAARARQLENIWLAIACHAGADWPAFQIACTFPPGQTARARWYDFGEEGAIRACLARARDVALERAEQSREDLRRLQFYWEIAALADAWGAPGYDESRRQRRAA